MTTTTATTTVACSIRYASQPTSSAQDLATRSLPMLTYDGQ